MCIAEAGLLNKGVKNAFTDPKIECTNLFMILPFKNSLANPQPLIKGWEVYVLC